MFRKQPTSIVNNPTRVAVIGTGHLGSIHTRVYSELPTAQLVAVCDTDLGKASKLAKKFKCEAISDFTQLFGKVDAVSVSVPTQHHFPIAKACLENDLHVLVEKPITPTIEEADELIALANQHKRVLQVGHSERFNATLLRVLDALEDPRFVEVHRLAAFQPRGTEVGVVLDLMIHDIDILLWLMGQPVSKLDACGVKVLTPFEDIANARVTFANKAVANLNASRISKDAMRKFRIFQKDTYISMDFQKQAVAIFRHNDGKITQEHLQIKDGVEPLTAELGAFLDAIRNGTPPPVSGEQAREALNLALQITQLVKESYPEYAQ